MYITYIQLFQTTKIQIFESNSQLARAGESSRGSCFRLQRYNFFKAIHNELGIYPAVDPVVSDYKDTNF